MTPGRDGGIGASEEAPLCETQADYDGAASRAVIGRTLRPHLEALCLTPAESLHGARQLLAILDQRAVVEAALGRVAALQTRAGQDPRARRAALQAAVEAVVRRAHAADAILASAPRSRTAVAAYLSGDFEGAASAGATLARAAVARDLGRLTTWRAKIDYVSGLVWQRGDQPLRDAVDEVLGDILQSPGGARELLGARITGGATLVRLLDLVQGRIPVDPAHPDGLGALAQVFRQGLLPAARAGALERVRRALKAPEPLNPDQAERDGEHLRHLVAGLITADGVIGDIAMAEALTQRYARRFAQGGGPGLRRALTAICESVPDLAARARYLAAMTSGAVAPVVAEEVVGCLEAAARAEAPAAALALRASDLAAARRRLGEAAAAIQASALPEGVRARLATGIERAVDGYALSGGLLPALERHEPTPARQAVRLDALIASGLIGEPGALALVRKRLSELPRQRPEDAPAREPAPPSLGDVVTRTAPARPVRPPEDVTRTVAPPAAPKRPAPAPGDARCPHCFARTGGAARCPECGHQEGMTPVSAAHLRPGTWLLRRYRVGRVLGQGGFGATYLGWDDRLQIKVAIKEYLPNHLVARIPEAAALRPHTAEHAEKFAKGIVKFLEEARTLAKLRDIREIVGVQDYFEDNNTAYLVMELLQGDTLKKYLADHGGKIGHRQALDILTPVMKALSAIHEMGLVHRDISPDNILMAGGGAKLLDFGAARETAGHGGEALTVILKPGYAPPEQYFSDGRQGPWTDVYALSATIYCAITGKAPEDCARRLQKESLVAPSALGLAVPPEFEKVLFTGLALRRQDRYPSMRALLAALGKVR